MLNKINNFCVDTKSKTISVIFQFLDFCSEFFFESEFRDEEKSDTSSRNEDRKDALREKSTTNKGRSKSKSNKKESSESKPLLGKCSEDLLGNDGTDDLLGLDLTSSNDSDALLLELASLDFGHLPSTKDGPTQDLATNDDLTFQNDQSFLANFDQIFGSTKPETEGDWNSFLPSHFLTSNFVSDESSLLLSNTSTPSLLSAASNAPKDSAEKINLSENTSKKVFFICKPMFTSPSVAWMFRL